MKMSCIAALTGAAAFFLAAAGFSASAAPSAAPNSARMAEYLYYSIPKSGLLADWLDSVKMSPERRTNLKEFTEKQKQKKAKLPAMEWLPGSSVIKVGSGARIYKIGFDKILSRRELLVNGVAYSAAADDDFEDAATELSQMAAPKGTAFEGFIAVLFYQFGLDEAESCNSPGGIANCASKTDGAIIKSLLGTGGTITGFQCEGRKFSAISVSRSTATGQTPVRMGITYEYDGKGKAQKATLNVQGETMCRYTLSEGKFVSVDETPPGRGNCEGRAASEWNGGFHPLHPGDVPKVFALVPIPIQRLQGCCADSICREEIAAAISNSNTATASNL